MPILHLQGLGEGLLLQQGAGAQGEDLPGAAVPPPGLPPHVPQVVGPSWSALPAPLLRAFRAASVHLAARLPLSEAGLPTLPGPPLTHPACLWDGARL